MKSWFRVILGRIPNLINLTDLGDFESQWKAPNMTYSQSAGRRAAVLEKWLLLHSHAM